MFKHIIKKIGIILFWLCIWQLISMSTGLEFLISSPVGAFKALFALVGTNEFYISVVNSFSKIILGFLIAFFMGTVFGSLSGKYKILYDFMSPLVYLCKALPMVAFIIFVLICFGSSQVSTIISFIVVFPIIYISGVNGYKDVDVKLLEMSKVFRMNLIKKIRYIYMPSISKCISDNISVALGMCWKAGVSAEVIGLVNNTIGTQMYYAKLYIMPDNLIAWSITVIALSVAFEYIFFKIFKFLQVRIEK